MKEKIETVDLIVLLNGNFIPLGIPISEKENCANALISAVKDGISKNDPCFYINIGGAVIFVKNIMGWYFRPKTETPADKIVKLLDKELGTGEDWKSDE